MATYSNTAREVEMPNGDVVVLHNAVTENTTSNIKKFKYDDNGHVTESTAADAEDLNLSSYSTPTTGTTAIGTSDDLQTAIGKLDHQSHIDQTNILSVEDMVCDNEFDTTTAYAVGDIVTYKNGLYEFTSAHSAGAWNSNHVTRIDVVGYVDSQIPTVMGASGSSHKGGLVPDTPSTSGTSKFLREDGTWAAPSGSSGGAVNTVYIGTTQYPPDSNGKVSLPAYPTTLPADGGTASNVSGLVKIENGGTGAPSAWLARLNLGLGSAATKSSTTSVTSESSSLVTSGAVYTALSGKQDTLTTAQLAAVDSGIDSTKVGQISANQKNILYVAENIGKNQLDTSLDALKAVNTGGTWNGNVCTYSVGTVTVNSDGTITVKKTSAASRLLFFLSSDNSGLAFSGTKFAGYILSGCPPTGSNRTYGINGEQISSPWGSIGIDYGTGYTLDTSPLPVYFYITLSASYTTPSDGITFKPMICTPEAWSISHEFEPYALPNYDLTRMVSELQKKIEDVLAELRK